MLTNESARRLCRHGAPLFVLGLVNGALVPALTNSRTGVSARRAARTAELLSLFSLYAIWGSLFLAAVFGTSRATPLAGAGFEGAAWQEALVATLLYTGSVGTLLGAGLVFWGLRAKVREAVG